MTTQFADGARGRSDFPPSWGEPPGDPFSEERAAWIVKRIHNAPVKGSDTRSAYVALAKANALAGRDHPLSSHVALAKADALARSSEHAWRIAKHMALKVRP
jgi:hypothetical protein